MFRDSHEDSTRESITLTNALWRLCFSLKKECSLIWILALIMFRCHSFHLYREWKWSLPQLIWRILCASLTLLLQMNRLLSILGFHTQAKAINLRENQYQVHLDRAFELVFQIRISCIPWKKILFSFSLNLFFVFFTSKYLSVKFN